LNWIVICHQVHRAGLPRCAERLRPRSGDHGTIAYVGRLSVMAKQEAVMTDYRDPNYRDPAKPGYRDINAPADSRAWSNATWGWIAGIAVVVLVLIFAFSNGTQRTATDEANPPATTGQRTTPATPSPSGGMNNGAPSARPVPAPAPAPKQ
jgi:hypothetical protein